MPSLRQLFAGALLAASVGAAFAQPLSLDTYNPGDKGVFPVSSTLIAGEHDLVLIDAQFSPVQAEELVARIRASGKTLKTIFISHGDPDFYFGLETLAQAFPQAQILATPRTLAYIEATRQPKLAYWAPILKDAAPKTTLVPNALNGDRLTLEGESIQVIGQDPAHTTLWIPSLKTVLGGVLISANMHVWTADAQTPEARKAWIAALDRLEALQPERVVPGHYLGKPAFDLADLRFTRTYLQTLESELPKARDSKELVAAMKRHYPDLAGEADLELSAKVLKGEMQWP
ncbi:MBL fold metallo-hydrolase [Pseudomonas sp. RIT-PI-AD]|uniref:MBL fold metallo-hydrolase n=1 Tax=Pseudomonas sp. RIT-PI-AD TaxID=3035294 RepID=UPI0021DA90E6|nr:MBL fold metallo-hydrolase [Pseudomonas sp. RIT-PI-AD]